MNDNTNAGTGVEPAAIETREDNVESDFSAEESRAVFDDLHDTSSGNRKSRFRGAKPSRERRGGDAWHNLSHA